MFCLLQVVERHKNLVRVSFDGEGSLKNTGWIAGQDLKGALLLDDLPKKNQAENKYIVHHPHTKVFATLFSWYWRY